MIDVLLTIASRQLIRSVTGNLLTRDQINKISAHAVGRYFAELFPEKNEQKSRRERIQLAQSHIEGAASIIADMKGELESQKETLNALIAEIEEKQSDARKFGELAKTNEAAAAAIREELESAVRDELTRSSQEGRWARRIISGVFWVVTLIAGAALGTYFHTIVAYFKLSVL